jgi:photosystem II stability/assembly factor-like uncharacterized protein
MGKNLMLAGVMAVLIVSVSGNLHGQQWNTLGLQGLDVSHIVLHPSAPESVFAVVADTIYKSTDGGATFTAVYTNPTSGRAFTAIAIAPGDPSKIIAGDGGNIFGNSAGFFQSTDGGRHWQQSPNSLPKTINGISIDPQNSGVAFFATTDGAYRLLVQKDSLDCNAAVYDPIDHNNVYEGLKQANGVGKSTDGGETWTYYTTGFPAQNYSILDIEVNTMDNQEVFASASWLELSSAIVYEIYKSSDGGATWSALGFQENGLEDIAIDPTQGILFAGHAGGLSIHPLEGGVFQSLTGDLPVVHIHSLAVDEGHRILAATAGGVFGLDYFPSLSGAYKSVDEVSGDNDEIPDPGETIDLSVGLRNSLFDGTGISATLSVLSDPTVTVTKGTAAYPDIPANSSADNSADPFTIVIDASADTHFVDLQLDITADGGYSSTDTVSLMIGAPTILIVDDDGGAAYDTFYTKTVDSLGVANDVWETRSMGPLTNQLEAPFFYKAVIWLSGDEENNIVTDTDVTLLTDYLSSGGRLILTGQNIVEDLARRGDPGGFLANVLHIGLADSSATGRLLFGVAGDVLGDQIDKCLISGNLGANNQTSPDILDIPVDSLGASPFLTYVSPPGSFGAVHVEDPETASQAIVLGFGFEAVNRSNPNDSTMVTRGELMSLMLDFMQPGVGIGDHSSGGDALIPRAFALGQNFPNPFNPSTTIKFSVPEGRKDGSRVTLKIYNLRGQLIRTLVDAPRQGGTYSVQWDGKTDSGTESSSGIYIYRISVSDHIASRKMILVK